MSTRSDFTCYFERPELADLVSQGRKRSRAADWEPIDALLKEANRGKGKGKGRVHSFSGQIRTMHDSRAEVFRALICRCDGGRAYSGTFRKIRPPKEGLDLLPSLSPLVSPEAPPTPPDWSDGFARPVEEASLYPKGDGFLFALADLVTVVEEAILGVQQPQEGSGEPGSVSGRSDGLVVVTGRTGTAKSMVAEGLIHAVLRRAVAQRAARRPHLVTLQDPIESRFLTHRGRAHDVGVDYTPRELGRDCPSVAAAVEDALRQTPAVLYVGEVRRPKDWLPVLRFSASGHLCVTTAHGGSLVESMRMLMTFGKATTAESRSALGGRIRAVVHLKSGNGGDPRYQFCLPALWCCRDRSLASFVSDGLASVLPHRSQMGDASTGCLGRRHFAEALLQKRASRQASATTDEDAARELRLAKEVRLQATTWDLLGE